MQKFRRIVFLTFLAFFAFFIFASLSFAQNIERKEQAIKIVKDFPEIKTLLGQGKQLNFEAEWFDFRIRGAYETTKNELIWVVKVFPVSLESMKEQFTHMYFEIVVITGKVRENNLEKIIKKDVQRIEKIENRKKKKMDIYEFLEEETILDKIERKWVFMGEPAVPFLITFLKDSEKYWTRGMLGRTLPEIGKPAVPYLIEALKDSKNSSSRIRIIGILGRFPDDPAVISALAEISKDENLGVREAIMHALNLRQDPETISLLKEAVKDESDVIRGMAIHFLATKESSKQDPSIIPLFVEALKDEDEFVRESAARGLSIISDTSAVSALIEVLEDKNSMVRYHAVVALGSIGDFSAVPALIEMLNAKEVNIMHVCSALANIGDPVAIPALEKISLKYKSSGFAGTVTDKKELEKRFGMPFESIRKGFEKTVQMAGWATSLEGLQREDEESVRSAAKQAIEKIKRRNKIDIE